MEKTIVQYRAGDDHIQGPAMESLKCDPLFLYAGRVNLDAQSLTWAFTMRKHETCLR